MRSSWSRFAHALMVIALLWVLEVWAGSRMTTFYAYMLLPEQKSPTCWCGCKLRYLNRSRQYLNDLRHCSPLSGPTGPSEDRLTLRDYNGSLAPRLSPLVL